MQRQTKNKRRLRKSISKIKKANISQKDINEDVETITFNQQGQKRFIYGTNVDINQAKKDLQVFIHNFQRPPIETTSPPQKPYRNMLIGFQDIQDSSNVLEVQGKDIFQFNKELYYQFIYFPCEMFQIFDEALKQSFLQFFATSQNEESITKKIQKKADILLTSIINLRKQQTIKIHHLSPKYINRLISVNALVTRVSQIIPELHQACFQCDFCYDYQMANIQNAKVNNPTHCKQCFKQNTMFINHNLSKFIDKQYIKLQQLPQQLEEGTTPIIIGAYTYQDNVDKVKSGDSVEIIGIYRATPMLIPGSGNRNKSVFKTHIDVIGIKINGQFTKILSKNTSFSDEEKRKFFKYADSPQIIDKIVKNFVPSIVENDIVKLGLLAQIFSGTPCQSFSNRPHIRSDINICLIGDPSTAKSQLLKQVQKISAHGVMVCGSGSSAQGLTVSVRKDPETSQFIIQGGALVMSNDGICCIDQFDKIGANSQTVLLQAMQQQTISVAKAGIVCQLKARTSLLVAANPLKSKYDTTKSVIENINLPPALLSRFDLIYILLDIPDKIQDLKIANHILSLYSSPKHEMDKTFIPHNQLLKYISFARNYVHPSISKQIGAIIGKQYCSMRDSKCSDKVIRSTPRQLQSIIRLSQAFAKMRLSQRVEKVDVELAAKIIREATLKAATDPLTGKIDITILTTGKSQAKRDEQDKIGKDVKMFLTANVSTYRKPTYIHKFLDKFKQRFKIQISTQNFHYILRKIQADDLIVIFGEDPKNLQFKLHKYFES